MHGEIVGLLRRGWKRSKEIRKVMEGKKGKLFGGVRRDVAEFGKTRSRQDRGWKKSGSGAAALQS
jgi:hypothetical protein